MGDMVREVSLIQERPIEQLHLTSPTVNNRNTLHYTVYSVSFIRLHSKKVTISTVILEMQAARNLQSTTVSTVAVARLPCRLDRAVTQPGVQVRY